MRIQLLLGRFNYGTRGILDLGHRRLFTFRSIREIFQQAGYKILKMRGIPAPYPVAIGDNFFSRLLLRVNQGLIKVFPRLFSYQIFLVTLPRPTLYELLQETIDHSGKRIDEITRTG